MDLTAAYCPIRRDLEEHGWFLTTRLSSLTSRLIQLIGGNHQAFLDMRCQCRAVTVELSQSHVDLRAHRRRHGC